MTIPRRRRKPNADTARSLAEDRRKQKELPIGGWLLVLNGKHKGDDFRIREGKNIIGSNLSCEVVLTDDYISERHASLSCKRTGPQSAAFKIVDLDSTNGTFHNDPDARIQFEELVDNDVVIFGQTQCKFKCVG